MYERLREDLFIDRDDLDSELVKQPGVFQLVNEQWAKAVSHHAKAKDDFKASEAETYTRLLAKRSDAGEKTTQDAMKHAVTLDKRYRRSQANLRAAQEELNRWQTLREAWQQRSYALKDLAALFISSYYTTDSSTAGSRGQVGSHEYEDRRSKLKRKRLKGD